MSTEFLLVDDAAAQAIVQATTLQSIEFGAGAQLADLIQRKREDLDFEPLFRVVRSGEGLYLLKPPSSGHYMVIDFAAVDPFKLQPQAALNVFQRLLRFAVRRWTGRRPSTADRHIQGSTKFAVFPFSIGTQTGYRLSVETSPDPKRVAKRFPGMHLLVYRDGYDAGPGPTFEPDTRVFRRAFEGLRSAISEAETTRQRASETLGINAIRSSTLSKREASPVSPHVGFDHWMTLLTQDQRDFVTRLPQVAERIEGPAGSGKTLSLVLKCINALRRAEKESAEFHGVFVAHSEATRATIEEIFRANCVYLDKFLEDRSHHPQTLDITTLQTWCANRLGPETISEAQFLDQDALTSKEFRRLIVEDCVRAAMVKDFSAHRPFLSQQFKEFLETEEPEVVADLLQHEIAVMIKGRAGEDVDVYRELPPVNYALPCKTHADRSFVYVIYDKYAKTLAESGEFDTDDVVLTALASLENPIWRRKRASEGYDAIFIDETHLFNLNELSVFHNLTRFPDHTPISFSVDRSQAPGDRGLTRALIDEAVLGRGRDAAETGLKGVFRGSKQIVALAASVTASGAGLFVGGFDDPLVEAEAIETESDEQLARTPIVRKYPSDEVLCQQALLRAGQLADELECTASEILIVTFSKELLDTFKKEAGARNKAIEIIEHRGDLSQVRRASKHSRYVVALPEFVGGLEFSGVILAGVDEGRVPPTPVTAGNQSRHFLSFRSHNHLYVAITRARYRVEVLVNETRGVSRLLNAALARGLAVEQEE